MAQRTSSGSSGFTSFVDEDEDSARRLYLIDDFHDVRDIMLAFLMDADHDRPHLHHVGNPTHGQSLFEKPVAEAGNGAHRQ